MNTILFIISSLALIVTIYKMYLTNDFKNKLKNMIKKLLFTLVLLVSLASCEALKNLAKYDVSNYNSSTSTTIINGHVYYTTITRNGNSYKVTTNGDGVNSTTYGHY